MQTRRASAAAPHRPALWVLATWTLAVFTPTITALANESGPSSVQDAFHEHLLLRSLPSGHLHALFTFTLSTSSSSSPLAARGAPSLRLRETSRFPASLLELIDRFGVDEAGISLGRGRWDAERWGWVPPASQLNASSYEAWDYNAKPRGGEVYAYLDPEGGASLDDPLAEPLPDATHSSPASKSWHGLVHALSGLLCGSLSPLSSPSRYTVPPPALFPPRHPSHIGFHGLLPLEHPCTENLSPLLRLLPCSGRAGLASLLDAHRAFEADWQSLGLRMREYDGKEGGVEAKVEIEVVLDPVRRDLSAGRHGKRDWSFPESFGKSLERTCPAASSSTIQVADSPNSLMEPLNFAHRTETQDHTWHSIDVATAPMPMSVSQKWLGEREFWYPQTFDPPPVSFQRILTGSQSGRIGVELVNHVASVVDVTVHEDLPWWIKGYMHTLTVTVNGVPRRELIKDLKAIPSIPRGRPLSLSVTLSLPPAAASDEARVRVAFDYSTAPLRYTEYASDANRGFDVPPAVAVILPGQGTGWERWEGRKAWTRGALINLATPDFSMPYNVIIVTSTVIALFFGSMFNLLVRNFEIVRIGRAAVTTKTA